MGNFQGRCGNCPEFAAVRVNFARWNLAVRVGLTATMRIHAFHVLVAATLALSACKSEPDDGDEENGPVAEGEACNPGFDEAAPMGHPCADGLACDPVVDTEDFVCGVPLEIRGVVLDAITKATLADALVVGLDRTGAPLGQIAVSDATGRYVLAVSAPRTPAGEIAAMAQYTLMGFAVDYQPFPSGIRVALPISAADAVRDEENGVWFVENPGTDVGLIGLPPAQRGGVTITGHVVADAPGGALVVAEGATPVSYAVSDAAGAYTLFNVHAGAVTVVGYRRGLELAPHPVTVADAALAEVDLTATLEGVDALATVSGQASLVNPGDGDATSVVLVPVSVFNDVLLRGPVPFGLRSPDPGLDPDVNGAFSIRGVPAGTYKVLAAFENDFLVRDPDTSIGGTELQEITVASAVSQTIAEGFKITGALGVVGPGEEVPEVVVGTPTFVFEDDSSEDNYIVQVFDVFGEKIWEKLDVPRVTGDKTVEVPYEGPALVPGYYYQFRAISMKDGTAISATEDLRGVFIAG